MAGLELVLVFVVVGVICYQVARSSWRRERERFLEERRARRDRPDRPDPDSRDGRL